MFPKVFSLLVFCYLAVDVHAAMTTDGCDSTKNCFRNPAGCSLSKPECRFISWRQSDDDGGSYKFEMSTGINGTQYFAMAFGLVKEMKDADLYYCYGTTVKSGVIQNRHTEPVYYDNVGITTSSVTMVRGMLQCEFTRPASVMKNISGDRPNDFDITKNQFYLLSAVGTMNGTRIKKHTWKTVTDSTFNFSKEITPITYDGCDSTKTCRAFPDGCQIGSPNCSFFSWAKISNGTFNFEMVGTAGNGNQYIAFALGTKSNMTDADLYYCHNQTVRSAAITVQHNPPDYLQKTDGLKIVSVTTYNKNLYCVMNRPALVTKTISGNISKVFDLNNEKYYLLAASGPMDGTSTKIKRHEWKAKTSERVVSSAYGVVSLHPIILCFFGMLAVFRVN